MDDQQWDDEQQEPISSNRDARLIAGLERLYQEGAEAHTHSLAHVWERLAQQQEQMGFQNFPSLLSSHGSMTSSRGKKGMKLQQRKHTQWSVARRFVGGIAALFFVTVLVGTLLAALYVARSSTNTASNVKLQGNKSTAITVKQGKMVIGSASGIYMTAAKDKQGNVEVLKLDSKTHKALWSTDVDAENPRIVVVGDAVYVSSSRNGPKSEKYVIALNAADGSLRWRDIFPASVFENMNKETGGPTYDLGYLTTPTVADGTVYVMVRNGLVFALDANTGKPRWHYDSKQLGVINGTIYDPSPLAVANGVIYGTIHHTYFALDSKSGKQFWSKTVPLPVSTNDQVLNAPVVVNRTVYISSFEPSHHNGQVGKGLVSAFDIRDGKLRWQFLVNDGVMNAVTVVKDFVYFGADDHQVYALNISTGKKQWSWDTHGRVFDTPLVENGIVYVSQTGNANEASGSSSTVVPTVIALDATRGHPIWVQEIGIDTSLEIIRDDVLYVGVYPNQIVALDTKNKGKKLWNKTYGMQDSDGDVGVISNIIVVS